MTPPSLVLVSSTLSLAFDLDQKLFKSHAIELISEDFLLPRSDLECSAGNLFLKRLFCDNDDMAFVSLSMFVPAFSPEMCLALPTWYRYFDITTIDTMDDNECHAIFILICLNHVTVHQCPSKTDLYESLQAKLDDRYS